MIDLDWNALLEERNAWVAHNFPNSPWHESVFGVVEEAGELAHAHLKMMQSIRGTQEEHDAEAMDAIGDATVYLLGVMNHFERTPHDDYLPPIRKQRPRHADDALLLLAGAVGSMARNSQPDREHNYFPLSSIDRIVYNLRQYCHYRGWDYNQIVLDTWARVKRRDWISDPVAGGEAGHWMLTIGTERAGLRATRGRLDRRGRFHRWQPCVFLLWRGRRV